MTSKSSQFFASLLVSSHMYVRLRHMSDFKKFWAFLVIFRLFPLCSSIWSCSGLMKWAERWINFYARIMYLEKISWESISVNAGMSNMTQFSTAFFWVEFRNKSNHFGGKPLKRPFFMFFRWPKHQRSRKNLRNRRKSPNFLKVGHVTKANKYMRTDPVQKIKSVQTINRYTK